MERRGLIAKRTGPLAAGLAAGLLLLGCETTRQRDRPPHELEIEERTRHLEEQFRSGNLLGIADLFADDAELCDAQGRRIRSRQEIDEYWSAIENPVDWRLVIRSIRGSDALVYELLRSELTTRGADGALETARADVLLLWRRGPRGEWRIVLDAFWPLAKR